MYYMCNCFKSVGSYKHKLSRIESLVILYWGINCIFMKLHANIKKNDKCEECKNSYSGLPIFGVMATSTHLSVIH